MRHTDREWLSESEVADAMSRLTRATRVVIRRMAIDVLAADIGDTLSTSETYREQLGVGAGTVQQGLAVLMSAGALKTASRGHQGREIVACSPSRLWRLAELDPVRVLLPPRGSVEVRAIAEFLAQALTAIGVPWVLAHRPGARERIDAIGRTEADLSVVSSGVYDGLQLASRADEVAVFPRENGTYYARDRVVVLGQGARRRSTRKIRVAIDEASWDQSAFTRAEFPEDDGHEYVQVDFTDVPVAILEGRVDAGVWHELVTLIPPRLAGIEVRLPQRAQARALIERSSRAMLLVGRHRPELRALHGFLSAPGLQGRVEALIAYGSAPSREWLV